MVLSPSLPQAPHFWGRLRALALGAGLLSTGLVQPAAALETVKLRLPLLQTSFTLRLSELASPAALMAGHSDLAELDRASNGALGRSLVGLFQTPLPLQSTAVLDQSVAQPLVQQVLLMVSSFGTIDGLGPEQLSPSQSGKVLAETLHQLFAKGQPSLLALLQALPGKSVTLDADQALKVAKRLADQQRRAQQLVGSQPAASVDPSLDKPGPLAVRRMELELAVSHRPQPLSLVVLQPVQGANGKLVVISHGLWDGPESFEGWAKHLANHGYTVLLPRHPGSDSSQQQALLSGLVPPPGPAELRLRPLDVSASLDAIAARQPRLGRAPRSRGDHALWPQWPLRPCPGLSQRWRPLQPARTGHQRWLAPEGSAAGLGAGRLQPWRPAQASQGAGAPSPCHRLGQRRHASGERHQPGKPRQQLSRSPLLRRQLGGGP